MRISGAKPAHGKISGETRHLDLPLFSQTHQTRRHWCDTRWSCADQASVLGTFCKSTVWNALFILLGKRAARWQNKAPFPWHVPKCHPLVSARQCPSPVGHTDEVPPALVLPSLHRLLKCPPVAIADPDSERLKSPKIHYWGLGAQKIFKGQARFTSWHMAGKHLLLQLDVVLETENWRMMTHTKALRKLISYPLVPLIRPCKMGQLILESSLKHLRSAEENARKPNHLGVIWKKSPSMVITQTNLVIQLLLATPIIMVLFPLHQSFT